MNSVQEHLEAPGELPAQGGALDQPASSQTGTIISEPATNPEPAEEGAESDATVDEFTKVYVQTEVCEKIKEAMEQLKEEQEFGKQEEAREQMAQDIEDLTTRVEKLETNFKVHALILKDLPKKQKEDDPHYKPYAEFLEFRD